MTTDDRDLIALIDAIPDPVTAILAAQHAIDSTAIQSLHHLLDFDRLVDCHGPVTLTRNPDEDGIAYVASSLRIDSAPGDLVDAILDLEARLAGWHVENCRFDPASAIQPWPNVCCRRCHAIVDADTTLPEEDPE